MGLSVSTSLAMFPKDSTGGVSQSARAADNIFLAWSLTNDLPSQSLTLTFPQARLFVLELVRADGSVAWSSPAPAAAPDWTYILAPGPTQPFTIPIIPPPDPAVVPPQVPSIRLRSICSNVGIPDTEDLVLRFTVLATQAPFVGGVRLWR
jgi:hypothetical protein